MNKQGLLSTPLSSFTTSFWKISSVLFQQTLERLCANIVLKSCKSSINLKSQTSEFDKRFFGSTAANCKYTCVTEKRSKAILSAAARTKKNFQKKLFSYFDFVHYEAFILVLWITKKQIVNRKDHFCVFDGHR